MDLLPLTFASGFASGINAYLTVFILGTLGRFLHIAGIPGGFERADVLVVMGILAVLELAADKIPYLDSAWDTISTFIRPVAGATIGALIAGAHGDLLTVALASVGGVTALLSTLSKSSIRMAINTSPEPVTNVTHSVVNDVTVTGIATAAALAPIPAAIVAGVLLVASIALAIMLFALVRKGWRRIRGWMADNAPATDRGLAG